MKFIVFIFFLLFDVNVVHAMDGKNEKSNVIAKVTVVFHVLGIELKPSVGQLSIVGDRLELVNLSADTKLADIIFTIRKFLPESSKGYFKILALGAYLKESDRQKKLTDIADLITPSRMEPGTYNGTLSVPIRAEYKRMVSL